MATVKITELPTVSSLLLDAVVPIVQSATTRQATIGLMQNSIGVYTGTGAPSLTADNGSIYLRNDGTSTTTVYYRANSAWVAQG